MFTEMCAENCPLSWALTSDVHTVQSFLFSRRFISIVFSLCVFFFLFISSTFFICPLRLTHTHAHNKYFGGRFQQHFYGLQLDNNKNSWKWKWKERKNQNGQVNNSDFFSYRFIKFTQIHRPSVEMFEWQTSSSINCVVYLILFITVSKKFYIFKWHEYNENSGTRRKAKTKRKVKLKRVWITQTAIKSCKSDTDYRHRNERRNLKLISKSEIKM